MINSLSLTEAELAALRGLQHGSNELTFADPVWAELQAVGLVEPHGSRVGAWALTPRGRRYLTD